MKCCEECLYGIFEGQANPSGKKVGQCRVNPPAVVVLEVPTERSADALLLKMKAGNDEPETQQIPIGAFPTVLEGMWCRMFAPRDTTPDRRAMS